MSTLNIVVAERDAVIGMMLISVLEEMGHTVAALVRREDHVMAAVERYRPDLLIVEARLDGGSGIAAVEAVLRTRFVPHVLISTDGLRDEMLDPRAVVLEKPFSAGSLVQAVREATRAADLRRQA